MTRALKAVHCPGVHTDSLGHYLSGLGLLTAAAQEWPSVRGCWYGGHFVLLADDISQAAIEDYLVNRWRPTPYKRWWATAQKADTKSKSCLNVRRLRNEEELGQVKVLDAHIVGSGRNIFNPLFGTGGSVGKRDLAKLSDEALALLSKKEDEQKRRWLHLTLAGEESSDLPDLSGAGTWFVFANKMYNSGQNWFREGRISPWSVLLATEGAFLLSGSVDRRLSARSRPYAVYPFVSAPSDPAADGEIGKSKAEFWAPLWRHPAILAEVRALFQRGLARIGGRPATAPHEFAIAARAAGVDAGISGFVRYELRQTTSSQVHEAIPRGCIAVGNEMVVGRHPNPQSADSDLLMQLIESGRSRWIDRLPYEPRDPKKRGKFVGLRGPVEAAIVAIAERPDDLERWQQLLLFLAQAQDRIDHNKNWRERCLPVPRLRPEWFQWAWPEPVPADIQVARAIASIGANGDEPLLVNVFGVEIDRRGRPRFPKARPQRAVWNPGEPVRVLCQVLERRLVDADPADPIPLDAAQPCTGSLLNQFLSHVDGLDLARVVAWVPPLSLIDWRGQHSEIPSRDAVQPPVDGASLLHDLVRPLFYPGTISIRNRPLFPRERRPHAGLARRLLNLLQHQAIDEAVQVADNWYLAAGHSIVMPPKDLKADGERIAAALLIPMYKHEISRGLCRWLQPGKAQRQ